MSVPEYLVDSYVLIKMLHAVLVLAVALLFFWRAFLTLTRPPAQNGKIPTLLAHTLSLGVLASGLTMVALYGQMPAWVLTKLIFLFVFIALGVIAFKRAKTRGGQLTMMALALLTYAFLVSVAVTKQATGFFG
ncbi:MAG: SirB2 family protein [Pseudomonadota bacterium]